MSFGKGLCTCNETGNSVDCEFFCANSSIQCAKTTLGIINIMTSVASVFAKDPEKAARSFGKTQQELNAFTQKFSFFLLKKLNGYPNSFIKGNSLESIDYFVTNVKAFFDAMTLDKG